MQYRRIEFLTRPGCGLCDEALPLVSTTARWLGVAVVVVDITDEPDLEAEYHLRIPVLLDRAGRVLAEGRIDRRRAITSALRSWF
jgi:hypothetical protein